MRRQRTTLPVTRALASVGIALLATFPLVADAAYERFCVKHTGSYLDNENGGYYPHDYWTDDLPKYARGQWISIRRNGIEVWQGNLYDGLGGTAIACTPFIGWMPAGVASFEFELVSEGFVNGNGIVVRGQNDAITWVSYVEQVNVVNNGTHWVVLPIPVGPFYDVFNVYQAGAYAIYMHNGGIAGNEVRYQVDSDWYRSAFYCDNSPPPDKCPLGSYRVMLKPSATHFAFTIAHETAHWIGDVRTQGVFDADTIDVSYQDPQCFGQDPESPHGLFSEEWAGGAAGEGFASFYAADVFNNHDQSDCGHPYWVNGWLDSFSCQDGHLTAPLAWHENYCGDDPYKGAEVDWIRIFWDVHTAGAAPDPTFTSVLDWLDFAGDFTAQSVYGALNASAATFNDDLEANWDNWKFVDGVDY